MTTPTPHRPQRRLSPLVARLAGGSALLAATLYLLRPFVVPLLWAGILAYVTWPLFTRLRSITRQPRLSAALLTAIVALLAGLIAAWLLVSLAQDANQLISGTRRWLDAGAPMPGWIAARPWLADRIAQSREGSVVDPTAVLRYATQFGSQISRQLLDVAGGLAGNAFKFSMTMLALFFFYRDGERLSEHAGRLATMAFPHSPELLGYVGQVVQAVVFGLVGTALMQGLAAGLGFALFGVPSPVALGALTVVASFIPAGPVFIWGGAALGLFAGESLGAAIGMAIYGAAVISSIDNFLRPLLISGAGVPIHFLSVFIGVLGGLLAFGMLGLFVGPVVLSVVFALLAQLSSEARAGGKPNR